MARQTEMASKQVFLLLCLLGMGYGQALPSPLQFLAGFLNATIGEVTEIVADFVFTETSEENIHFVLYLPTNETQEVTSENVLNFINPNISTKILIHGWTDSAYIEWISQMSDLYHQKGDYNVIAPDYSKDAAKNYLHAAAVSRSVGNIIGQFLLNVANTSPNFLGKLHIIGHSLGGQVAGFTGKKIAASGKKADRVTGLDAASPLFEFPIVRPPSLRLDKTDASFVDLIHTNIGLEGVALTYGTADFFVNNGGPIQPSCENVNPVEAISCSHHRAHMIYSETILDEDKYNAVSCHGGVFFDFGLCSTNTKAYLGEGVNRNARGSYYVKI